ncbi:hypothetical protein TSMEX_005938 [Taenia solium]|eukprot:TsM_000962500 transcript=TsM_000962500 gene=TsM_000962500
MVLTSNDLEFELNTDLIHLPPPPPQMIGSSASTRFLALRNLYRTLWIPHRSGDFSGASKAVEVIPCITKNSASTQQSYAHVLRLRCVLVEILLLLPAVLMFIILLVPHLLTYCPFCLPPRFPSHCGKC